MALLPNGTQAPDFGLKSTPDQRVRLSDFKGKAVVLVFYPADWSPVCGDELALLNEVVPALKKNNTELIAISVDNTWCHIAYSQSRRFRFPLLSDFEPKGEIAKKYRAYSDEAGVSERAIYLIDGDGKIVWSHLSPMGINPGADGLLDALDKLREAGKLAA